MEVAQGSGRKVVLAGYSPVEDRRSETGKGNGTVSTPGTGVGGRNRPAKRGNGSYIAGKNNPAPVLGDDGSDA